MVDEDDPHACSGCPFSLFSSLDRAFRAHIEAAVIHWLQTMVHTPSCGYEVKGDLIRWSVIGGHRLPTIRDDLLAAAVERNIETPDGELVSVLVDRMDPSARSMLSFALAWLQ